MYQPEIGVSTAAFYPTYLTEDALTAAGELGPELMALRISESYDQFRALTAVAR